MRLEATQRDLLALIPKPCVVRSNPTGSARSGSASWCVSVRSGRCKSGSHRIGRCRRGSSSNPDGVRAAVAILGVTMQRLEPGKGQIPGSKFVATVLIDPHDRQGTIAEGHALSVVQMSITLRVPTMR